MDIYTIDVETYYDRDYSLSKLTTEEYVRDPRFELIGLGIKKNDKKARWVSGDILEVYAALHTIDWSTAAIVCHNTMFDGAVLSWRLGVRPKVWFDTLSMSRAVHGPDVTHSLAALAKRYRLPDKGDEVVRALGKRREDFTAAELSAYADYCVHDTNLCYELFRILAGGVPGGFPRNEFKLIDMTLRMFTEPRLQLNRAKLESHLEDTIAAKQALLDRVGVDKKELMSNDKFAALLTDLGVDPPRKVSATTGKEAWAFAKTDEAFRELEEHENPDVQALVAARLGNKTTLEETRTQRFIGISERGLLPIPLRYYAAHTSRWGGADKLNLQNLPSRGPNAKKIKAAIEAPPGHVIIEADSAQIEARVLAWMAEQEDVVQAFREKKDVYKKMAAAIYGVREEDVTKDQRQVGKTVVLGAGYGVGHIKLQAFLKMQAGVEVSEAEAKRIVGVYRETNNQITKFWRDANNMLTYMTRGVPYQFGRYGVLHVDVEREGVRLPSGLYIRYPGLEAHQNERGWDFTYTTRKGPNKIYGGKVVENCLAGDTDVLTDSGWVPLRHVTRAHRVWDGCKWVTHDGLIYQGEKPTTVVNGVRMTPDHNVLTEKGWRCASSSQGLHRAGFWLPDGAEVSGDKWATLHVGLPMQVWDGDGSGSHRRGEVRQSWRQPFLRVLRWGGEQIARAIQAPGVLGMAFHAGQVPTTNAPSVAQLRGSRHQSMPGVGAVIRGVLGGHGADVPPRTHAGPQGQRWGLHPGELPMGYAGRPSGEPSGVAAGGHNQSAQNDGHFQVDLDVPMEAEPVYDLRNAGPDARFVVRGSSGPFIVHNCVQALARIVVGEQMLRINKKYAVALTVHDSVVLVVPESEATEAQAYVDACMAWTPKWAAGLPVSGESGVGKNYGET